MGFLDLLKGKKKETGTIPPPVPGPVKTGVQSNISPSTNGKVPLPNPNDTNKPQIPPPIPNKTISNPPINKPKLDDKSNLPPPPNPKAELEHKLPDFSNQGTSNKEIEPLHKPDSLTNHPKPIETNHSEISKLNIPKPPSDMTQKIQSDLGVNPTPLDNMKHDYDFSLPQLKDTLGTPNNSTLKKPDLPKKNYSEKELQEEKIELRTNKDIDRFTDNEDMGLIQKRLQVHRSPGGPIFVEVTNYRHVLDGIDFMKAKLKESGDYMFKIEEYNEHKHNAFEQWKDSLEDIQRKLVFVEKTLFEKKAR